VLSGTNVDHVYNTPGNYTVTLRCEYEGSCSKELVTYVTVSEPLEEEGESCVSDEKLYSLAGTYSRCESYCNSWGYQCDPVRIHIVRTWRLPN
jgi:PKD repeat protein